MAAMIRRLSLAIALLAATPALAQDDAWCRNGLFPAEPPFGVADVTGKGRLWFHDDADGCPDKGEGACRARAYVLPGDALVIGRARGQYTCAFYPSRGGGTAGWVETVRLRPRDIEPEPSAAAWSGTWTSAGNPVVVLREDDGILMARGEAWWPGPAPTRDYPTVHVGTIDGPLHVTGNRAAYADEDLCEIAFTLLGDWLVSADNNSCGGANVSFSGVLRRKRTR